MLEQSYPAILLYLMCTLDSALVGFRVVSGRHLRIRKRRIYQRSMLGSLVIGQGLLLLSGLAVSAALALAADRGVLWRDFLATGRSMLLIYGPYSSLVLLALGLYLIPKTDSRSLATVVVLGPFTLLRPYVFVAGLCVCWLSGGSLSARLLATLGVGLQLCLEPVLEWRHALAREASHTSQATNAEA